MTYDLEWVEEVKDKVTKCVNGIDNAMIYAYTINGDSHIDISIGKIDIRKKGYKRRRND